MLDSSIAVQCMILDLIQQQQNTHTQTHTRKTNDYVYVWRATYNVKAAETVTRLAIFER